MNLRGVVIPVDPFEGFPLDFTHRFPWADLIDDLGLEEADDAFGEGIVVGVTDGSPVAQHLKMRGKPHKLVIVAIARRLVTIANAILKTGVPWQQNPAA